MFTRDLFSAVAVSLLTWIAASGCNPGGSNVEGPKVGPPNAATTNAATPGADAPRVDDLIVGGPTKYSHYAGTATIVRVEKTEKSNALKGMAAEGYEVWYTFVPKEEIKEDLGKNFLSRFKQFQFTLGYSGLCPGPLFLKKYDIEPGKQFACTMLVETQGTATPVILQFDTVPADFFEAAPGR